MGAGHEFELSGGANITGSVRARLKRVVDRNDNGFEISYDEPLLSERITSVSDVHDPDRKLAFTYEKQDALDDDSYRITEITKHENTLASPITWEYEYESIVDPAEGDTRWYLTKVTVPQDGQFIGAGTIETEYDYYDPAAPTSDPEAFAGLLKRIENPNGDYREFEYYLNGRKWRETSSANATGQGFDFETASRTYSYNLVMNSTEVVDERGNATVAFYESNGNLLRQINPDRTYVESEWGIKNGINSTIPGTEYLIVSSTDEVGATESYTYYGSSDGFRDRQLKESTSKRFLMSDGSTLVLGTHPGIVTQYDYRQGQKAGNSHIVDTETVTVITPNTGDSDYTTTYEYYESTHVHADLQKSITNTRNEKTSFTYYSEIDHTDGLLKTQTRPKFQGSGIKAEYFYDTAGNLTYSLTDKVAPETGTYRLTTTEYDHNGMPVKVTDGEDVVYESDYDIIGRLHATRVGDGPTGALADFANAFVYDESGQIEKSTDRNGNTTVSTYDLRGNIITRTNPDGTETNFEYDQSGNLVSQTDALGRTTRFVYDSRNRQIQTIHSDGAIDRVYYDGVGRVAATEDARGNRTSYTYDSEGRQLSVTNANPDTAYNKLTNVYDDLGRLVQTKDFNGHYTLFEHDELGRVVETRILHKDDMPGSITNNPEFVSTTEYDTNGNVQRTAVYDVDLFKAPIGEGGNGLALFPANPTDLLTAANLESNRPLLQVTETTYDSLDRPTKTTQIGASVTESGGAHQDVTLSTSYDDAGRVQSTTDELGRVTQFVYDAYGRLTKTIFPDPDGAAGLDSPEEVREYDAAGNLIRLTDPNGHITTNEYDFLNRLVITTDAEGNTSRSVYDVAGQMVATIDALDRAQYLAYDNRGRVTREQTADPDGNGPQAPLATKYEYDGVGNRTSTENVNGYVTTSAYDELNRLEKEVSTDVQIYDIVDPDNDLHFSVGEGTATPVEDVEGSVARKHFDVTGDGVAPEVSWTFDNLEAGEVYSISLTWDGDTSLDDNASATITVNGTPTSVDINQQRDPDDFALDYQGQWRGWRLLAKDIENLTAGGSIVVTLMGSSAAATIRADALMLDRQIARTSQYDGNGNLLSQTDVLGRETTNTYDSRNLLTSTTLPDPDQGTSGGGPNGDNLVVPVIDQVYDGFGNVIEIIERRGNGASDDRTQKLTYDRRNRVITTTLNYKDGVYNDTLNNDYVDEDIITRNFYDDAGNLKQVTNAVGSKEQTIDSFEYDNLNRLEKEYIDVKISSSTKLFDPAISTTINTRLAYEHENQHEYDPAGNLLKTISITNDPGGVNSSSVVSDFVYDNIHRLVRQTDDVGTYPDHINATSRLVYDAVSNVLKEIDPTGRITTNEYDRLNRVVTTTLPHPGNGQTTPSMQYVYDTLGNVARATNGEGETTQSIFDTLGREISRFDANNDETRYRYDAFGNLLSLIDAEHNKTDFSYDHLDRIKTDTIYNDSLQPLTRTYTYDDSQNLKRYIDRKDRGVEYTYDDLDRLTTEEWHSSGSFAGTLETLRWYYDAVGRVTRTSSDVAHFSTADDLDYEATWEYDNLDRVTKSRNFAPSSLTPSGGRYNPRFVQNYAYDIIRPANNAAPHESTVTQFIEPAHADNAILALAKVTYTSDRLGRIVGIEDANQTGTSPTIAAKNIGFSYDAAGRMLSTQRDSGSLSFDTLYGYDGTGRINSLSHTSNDLLRPFASYAHTYDSASRIVDRSRTLDTSIASLKNLESYRSERYSFDDAGQLTQRNASDTTGVEESYTYDENGNRKDANGLDYDTRKNNRVFSDGVYEYRYDEEGNLTAKFEDTSKDGNWNGTEPGTEFLWDHRNRLVEVIDRDGSGNISEKIHYAYDNDNLRVRKVVRDPTLITSAEQFVYDGSQLVATIAIDTTVANDALETTGWLANRYLNGTDVDELLVDEAFVDGGAYLARRWAANDHLGSVAQLLSSIGAVVEHREYDAFGNISEAYDETGNAKQLDALDSAFAFAGREWDNDADLYYNRARWLDANLGRFISVDPLGFDAGDANLYRYSGNDPLNRFDPSGESWLSSIFDTIGDVFKKVGREIGRVARDVGEFVIDTAEFLGDTIDSTIDTFEFIIKNPEDAFKAMISDPLFWGNLALGFVITTTFSFGFFDVGLNLNGLNVTPDFLEFGRQALSAVTGGGFNIPGPALNVSSQLFGFAQRYDAGGLTGQRPQHRQPTEPIGGTAWATDQPYWVTDDPVLKSAVTNYQSDIVLTAGRGGALPSYASERLNDNHTIRVDKRGNPFGGFEIHVYDNNGNEVAKLNGAGGFAVEHNRKTLPKPNTLSKELRADLRKVLRREAKVAFQAGRRVGSAVTTKAAIDPSTALGKIITKKINRGSRNGIAAIPSVPTSFLHRLRPKTRGALSGAGPAVVDVAGGLVLEYANELSGGFLYNSLDNTLGSSPSSMLENMKNLFWNDPQFYWRNLGNKTGLHAGQRGFWEVSSNGDKVFNPRPTDGPTQ